MTSHPSHKNIFVILGVARSGTSAIARGLKALGIELGDKMNPADTKWNAKGFWEDTDIVYNINSKAFSALNIAPYGIDAPSPEQQTSDALHAIKLSAIELLQHRFVNTAYWGFKDPSTVKLLTFWQMIFAELQLTENYIIALRNPLETAQSYQKVTGSDIEIGFLLWLAHIIPAIEETVGKNRTIVSYDLLMQHPEAQLQRMQTQLQIPSLSNSAEVKIYTEGFLDKKLHRHAASIEDLLSHPASAVAPLCARMYQLLMQVAQDQIDFASASFTNEWHEIKNELKKMYPVYRYIDRLLKENHLLKKNLRRIQKSILWKMLYPLRKIDDTLRARRQKKRAENRLTKAYG